jgi:hypothetical protein
MSFTDAPSILQLSELEIVPRGLTFMTVLPRSICFDPR